MRQHQSLYLKQLNTPFELEHTPLTYEKNMQCFIHIYDGTDKPQF